MNEPTSKCTLQSNKLNVKFVLRQYVLHAVSPRAQCVPVNPGSTQSGLLWFPLRVFVSFVSWLITRDAAGRSGDLLLFLCSARVRFIIDGVLCL